MARARPHWPALPHAPKGRDKGTIPAVLATYLALWEGNLATLGIQADATFTTDPPKRLGIG